MQQLFRPKYEVEEILRDLRNVLESGWTGTGPKCREFENNWGEFVGNKFNHYLHSATAALHIAVRLLDLPKGSKILTSPLTFVSTNAAILYEGHIPVFCDINPNTLSMSFDDAIKKIKEHDIKAVVWVHYSGHATHDFERLMQIRDDLGIKIIEDGAHAGGGFYADGRRIGSQRGNIYCASYQAVKNIPTFDGGLISVPNQEMLDRAKRLAWMGIDKDTFARTNSNSNELYKWEYTVNELGWKYNGNDISATIANIQLKYADRDNAYRLRIYNWYNEAFSGAGKNILVEQSEKSSHHLVVIRVKNRNHVMAALKANGFAAGVHYMPNYEFPVFSRYYNNGDCPMCEQVSKEIISLPNHLLLTKKDVDAIAKVVLDAISC